ncbi:hypothetical protein GCM10010493_54350 [Streptomyces lavendulae subsp. grasserius]
MTAVVALLAAVALSDLFALYAGARVYALIDADAGFAFAAEDELRTADLLYRRAGMFQGSSFLLCAAVFIAWFHRMRRATGALAPDAFERGSGWAIGAWLIPVVNLWLPFRIALGMWGAAVSPSATPGRPVRLSFRPVEVWWVLFVLTRLFDRYTAWLHRRAEGVGEFRDALFQGMLSDALNVVAAAAAVHFAVRLSAAVRRRTV